MTANQRRKYLKARRKLKAKLLPLRKAVDECERVVTAGNYKRIVKQFQVPGPKPKGHWISIRTHEVGKPCDASPLS